MAVLTTRRARECDPIYFSDIDNLLQMPWLFKLRSQSMPMTKGMTQPRRIVDAFATRGMFWLVVATLGAAVFFADGLGALREAWKLPEYSHGPIIPVLGPFCSCNS